MTDYRVLEHESTKSLIKDMMETMIDSQSRDRDYSFVPRHERPTETETESLIWICGR